MPLSFCLFCQIPYIKMCKLNTAIDKGPAIIGYILRVMCVCDMFWGAWVGFALRRLMEVRATQGQCLSRAVN